MKGSWVTTFAVGGVVVLLTLFLGLQYNWLVQAGDAERERMQRRVEMDTKNFAEDLNREVQAAYFNFQIGAEAWQERDFAEFAERYDYWKGKTGYPGLIRDFIFIPKAGGAAERYDAGSRSFVASPLPPELEQVSAKLDDRSFAFIDEATVLVMPVREVPKEIGKIILRRTPPGQAVDVGLQERHGPVDLPERFGSLLIVLDRDVLTNRILPDLTAKHFPEGNFKVSVANSSGGTVYAPAGEAASPDAKAGLMNLSPDNFLFFTNGGVTPPPGVERRAGVVVNQRVETATFSKTEVNSDGTRTGQVTLAVKPGPGSTSEGTVKARTSIFASSDPFNEPWRLNVQHTAGSIDAYTRGEFRKSFAVGLGLYVLLVGAIIAIVVSAMRSKRFAQRQIDFVSSVSHEFRTPLAVIYSAGENLADGVAADRDQVSRYGNLIKGEGRKLSAMVEQILQFAGARSGRRKYNFSPAQPSELIAAALNDCTPLLEEKGFEVETAVDEELPAVSVDGEAMATALQNLISNSVKYSNGSRWLKISASNGGGRVKLTVEDRGIGIADGDLRQVFEPFYRARNVVDAQIHGNGLGLALVKEIAEAHGGTVRAESEPGKGSRFTIELPRA